MIVGFGVKANAGNVGVFISQVAHRVVVGKYAVLTFWGGIVRVNEKGYATLEIEVDLSVKSYPVDKNMQEKL